MRNVGSHLLEDKMDEVVTHYINSHQPGETVHVDANTLALNVHDEAGRVVTVMHGQGFTQMSRHVSVGEQVGEGPWSEELLDPEGRLAALVAHLAQHSRSHHQSHHKVSSVRDVDTSVILDTPLRLFNGHALDQQPEPLVVEVPHLPPLPPLQEMKRCQESDWFSDKSKTALKDDNGILTDSDGQVLELGAGASPAQSKQSKKSLPHKKRISRKLKRTGNCTPQQDIVVINCNEEVPQEEILPDNFVTGVSHHDHDHDHDHLPDDTHHITHEVRPVLICQLCGEFYAEDQLKFYHHLKQHYEPHGTIIIENPVNDLSIDKMTNTCIVDNVATLPDSIVELSLENTVPKTMYQPMDKHILYATSDKALYSNKVQYSMAQMDKEPVVPTSEAEKSDLYETFDKMELYSCTRCNKSFRKQKQCEAHIKEAHSNSKLDDMGEFSEPEDLMEGIHVAVEEGGEQYEQNLLPHLTVENGHVHQEHVRHWYLRGGAEGVCGAEGVYCPVCPAPGPPPPPPSVHPPPPPVNPPASAPPVSHPHQHPPTTNSPQLKEEVLQRIFETEVSTEAPFTEAIIENDIPPDPAPPETDNKQTDKKKNKKFECPQCDRVFQHRNSLLYHELRHGGKQQECQQCGKGFYTVAALKIHKRVHNGDKPYKCEDCGRDFRQWSDLKYHKVSLHSDQKHFKCEFCGKEFARKYSLNVHRRIHTGEKNYKCEYCNKTFRASSYRLSHMRTHTGVKPYKCSVCEKCFRVAGDMRRHMQTHEKVRNRIDEQKKLKDPKKEDNIDDEPVKQPEIPFKIKKDKILPTAPKTPVKIEKKPKSSKKNSGKKGAPNVTVNQNKSEGQFKINTEYTNNVEVYDTRQDFNKFKEVYSEPNADYNKDHIYKTKDYTVQMTYKDSDQRLSSEREFATLRPMFRDQNMCEVSDKTVLHPPNNTDGKMQVFTHIEKKEFSGPIVSNPISLSDIRERDSMPGETLENGFLERLTALYNIPAV